MRKFYILISFVIIMNLLVACSSHRLELVEKKVEIINDKNKVGAIGITEGKNKGKEVVPTALIYEFTLENVDEITKYKEIELKIIPSDKLKDLAKEIIGFNFYNPDDYYESGLGYGGGLYSASSLNGNKAKFKLMYEIGVDIDDPQILVKVPSEEKLNQLKDAALDGTLVIYGDKKEIVRLELKE